MSLQTSILRNLKFAFIAAFALVFFLVPATTASAKSKKAKYATRFFPLAELETSPQTHRAGHSVACLSRDPGPAC
jgi:hypothetical protein